MPKGRGMPCDNCGRWSTRVKLEALDGRKLCRNCAAMLQVMIKPESMQKFKAQTMAITIANLIDNEEDVLAGSRDIGGAALLEGAEEGLGHYLHSIRLYG